MMWCRGVLHSQFRITHLKADNPLYGSSLIKYALVEQWIDFATLEIDANILRWFIPRIGFWDMYDPEGYSLWFCDYKYNDENTVSFVTLNKVGGFLQRMDLARKYAFGKMLVIGSVPPFKVKGLWLFRGQEVPQFIIDECYDMELYDWCKVDITDEDQKERVNQMIEDHEPFEGRLCWMPNASSDETKVFEEVAVTFQEVSLEVVHSGWFVFQTLSFASPVLLAL
ncbi:putative translation elongation factor EF1B, gamma chain, glutathione S-transferase [Rosa chinensis]|uniref:Putative translation elongation factor EF1B, gamma chain, glutathione S-transferase n=1 Tax=Rosa chinensis TaxID=74649 RepID=A0A2P6PF42_ROSCH|nr:putative translation elongation factor EF1B, gamma chain, glutathione S-transferase [Rosa chinensis]